VKVLWYSPLVDAVDGGDESYRRDGIAIGLQNHRIEQC
jgi:hypothetical protein